MRVFLTKLASPILNALENSQGSYEYSPSHRIILKVMGFLFFVIAGAGLYFSLQIQQWAGLFPVILFAAIGILCWTVAFLGSDKAVGKLWRNRND